MQNDMFKIDKKAEEDMNPFLESVAFCNLCERMNGRVKVLSHKNGNINAKVLFIAEAPGRLGADRTAIPLYGDKAGDNFSSLLSSIGWDRKDIFITNAILCNPRQENGNNGTPTKDEIYNCSNYLKMTIQMVNPDVIVTLGATALSALSIIQNHNYKLKDCVGKVVNWLDKKLFIAYHTGQRAAVHRSLANQRKDFIQLSKIVDPIKGLKIKKYKNFDINIKDITNLESMLHIISFLVSYFEKISKFKLVKLLYLLDYNAVKNYGSSLSGVTYIRQEDGPWPPSIEKALKILSGNDIIVKYSNKQQYIIEGPAPKYIAQSLTDDQLEMILSIVEKYKNYSNSEIKTSSYHTRPMRDILKRESIGEKLLNKPIIL